MMRAYTVAAVCGLLFGLGLTVSQMIDPNKVLGFLDIAGDWDPSLILVMAGAIPLAAVGYWAGGRVAPARSAIDKRLMVDESDLAQARRLLAAAEPDA